ncbi:response regulator transcription factor [Methylobacterium nonmethylotrophicum]|uniref:Response regulator transcription factor n=1 Tax=Methylobacterium nonmethylotrophicum TaxID=1141884 RepID=A0A4Z0NSS9_9HYPH|nr:response regulator [Methylobacterium nonmethylotrophicum]TGD99667.1 response regulator transcription factor [Methylobacterium nonmethylotrophicum]
MSPPGGDGIVYVVDDDWRICEALDELMAASGLSARTFQSMGAYLAHNQANLPGCLGLDVDLLDTNGLDVQEQIADDHPPIVFITGHGDNPFFVRDIKRGAVNFLTKPYGDAELLAPIRKAIELDRAGRAHWAELQILRSRYNRLTPREREALPLFVSGLLNKQAAAELGSSDVTMQIHRSKIMHKMDKYSLADLVRMAGKLKISINHSRAGKRPFHGDHP